MLEQDFKGKIEHAIKVSKELLVKQGEVPPKLFVDFADKKEMVVVDCKWEDDGAKLQMVKSITEMMKVRNPTAYIFVSEGWGMEIDATKEDPKDVKLPIRTNPRKQEMLVVSGETINKESAFVVIPFTKKKGKVVMGEEKRFFFKGDNAKTKCGLTTLWSNLLKREKADEGMWDKWERKRRI